MPTPCWCVVCTLLQDDDCGSGSGNVYNDTTITTTTKAAAAEAMAGNQANAVQTTMESLKISIFTFIFDIVARLHSNKLNYRGLKTQHFSLHAIFYTYTYSLSLLLSLGVFLCVSDASYFSKLIRFWLCTGCFFHRSQDIYNSVYFNQLFLCTRSSKLPMCSLHVLNAANVWNFTFDVQILDNTIQFSSV